MTIVVVSPLFRVTVTVSLVMPAADWVAEAPL